MELELQFVGYVNNKSFDVHRHRRHHEVHLVFEFPSAESLVDEVHYPITETSPSAKLS